MLPLSAFGAFLIYMKSDSFNAIDDLLSAMSVFAQAIVDGYEVPASEKSVKKPRKEKEPRKKRSSRQMPDYYNVELFPNQCEWCPDVQGYCAYILRCEDGTTYEGFSGHFKKRMIAHFNGCGSRYTKSHKPLFLLHYEVFEDREAALNREKFFQTNLWWIQANKHKFTPIYPDGMPPTQEPANYEQKFHID